MQPSASSDDSGAGETGDEASGPQGLVHRRVLDVAAARPTASTERIAADVGVGRAFVERVFAEFGDPASADRTAEPADEDGWSPDDEDSGSQDSDRTHAGDGTGEQSSGSGIGEHSSDTQAGAIDVSDLNGEQVETLRVVHEHPGATQSEVADRLGVSRSTVSKRINGIPGFGWVTRQRLATALFGDAGPVDAPGTRPAVTDGAGVDTSTGADLWKTEPEGQATGDEGEGTGPSLDPEIVHKAAHACLDAEYISTDEELAILRRLLVQSR